MITRKVFPTFGNILLDEGIAKVCKKLKCHDDFLSYLQDSTANPAHLGALFCPVLVCP